MCLFLVFCHRSYGISTYRWYLWDRTNFSGHFFICCVDIFLSFHSNRKNSFNKTLDFVLQILYITNFIYFQSNLYTLIVFNLNKFQLTILAH